MIETLPRRDDDASMTEPDQLPALARNVKKKRRFMRLSQVELAERCEVSRRTICRVERGEQPSRLTILRLADALEMTPEALLEDTRAHSPLTRYLLELRDALLLASARTLRAIVRNVRSLTGRARATH